MYTVAVVLKKKVRQSRPWVELLVHTIEAAIEKLNIYFNQTYNNLGSIYILGTILSSSYCLSIFEHQGSWLNKSEYWSAQYKDQLQQLYKNRYSDQSIPLSTALPDTTFQVDSIAMFIQQQKQKQQEDISTEGPDKYKVDIYLAQYKFTVIFIVIEDIANPV